MQEVKIKNEEKKIFPKSDAEIKEESFKKLPKKY